MKAPELSQPTKNLLGPEFVELELKGMTCATCATRIEKKLNKLPGAVATVNFATEKAAITFDPAQVSPSDLIAAVNAAGYSAKLPVLEAQESQEKIDPDAPLKLRLLGSSVLSLPVLAMSMVPSLEFRNWQWLAFALAAPVVLWGGWPFHRAAYINLLHKSSSMDTLISLGSLSAFLWSSYALFFSSAGNPGFTMAFSFSAAINVRHPDIYLETASVVISVILLGRYLEARGKRRSTGALSELASGIGKFAYVLRDNIETQMPVESIVVGDRVVVKAGDRVPVDGVIVEGSASMELSFITGEALPRRLSTPDEVIGGTLNLDGHLVIQATKVGSDTAMSQLVRLVEQAQAKKAAVQHLVDRISSVFVPVVVVLSVGTLFVHLFLGYSAGYSFATAVAVLIIACPCALGLATPMAILVGTGRAAQLGILIRGPEALEAAGALDVVVLDKTGTITTGEMTVIGFLSDESVDYKDILSRAASAEYGSLHPIAKAIENAALLNGIVVKAGSDFESISGHGATALVEGINVTIGRLEFLRSRNLQMSSNLKIKLEDLAKSSAEHQLSTLVFVGWDSTIKGVLMIGDEIRRDAKKSVAAMKRMGLEVRLLTGDSQVPAHVVAQMVGIEQVYASVSPTEKQAVVKEIQQSGNKVAMVGDGINDAAALAQADLGISMGSGTQVAMEASDLTVLDGGVQGAFDAIRLARKTLLTIKGNLFWAFAYNIVAIPIAAIGLVNPVIAGTAMAFSSVFVVTNSVRLFAFRPSHLE